MITNQPEPAHGDFTTADQEQMHAQLSAELERLGVRLDAIYDCPHDPDGTTPEPAIRCVCRNPQPGLLLRAAAELDLDLQRSWLVGDMITDIEAGKRAGCRTILVDLGSELQPMLPIREPHFVAQDTAHALDIIATFERLGPVVDLSYLPRSWEAAREIAYGA
jgi:D-glycero-D-manno-heptose 1,7-bisphosphate phosphatase